MSEVDRAATLKLNRARPESAPSCHAVSRACLTRFDSTKESTHVHRRARWHDPFTGGTSTQPELEAAKEKDRQQAAARGRIAGLPKKWGYRHHARQARRTLYNPSPRSVLLQTLCSINVGLSTLRRSCIPFAHRGATELILVYRPRHASAISLLRGFHPALSPVFAPPPVLSSSENPNGSYDSICLECLLTVALIIIWALAHFW
jgi:hypothetical protein